MLVLPRPGHVPKQLGPRLQWLRMPEDLGHFCGYLWDTYEIYSGIFCLAFLMIFVPKVVNTSHLRWFFSSGIKMV